VIRSWGFAILQLATRKRIGLTLVIFAALITCDVMLWKTQPCDLFDWTSGTTVLGELLLAGGLLLRTWAAGTLRKRADLVTSGPYLFVRNPLYIGSFLMMLGFSVLLRDWLAVWIVLGPVLAMYLNKIRQEEKWLANHHPDTWPAYTRATPKFIPLVDRWPSFSGFSFRQWASNHEYQALLASAAGLIVLWLWGRSA